jgi:hypothetical protein
MIHSHENTGTGHEPGTWNSEPGASRFLVPSSGMIP